MKTVNLLLLAMFYVACAHGQNVGINSTGAAPDAGAGLDINFTNKGLLIPRVDITNINTIAPVTGSTTEGLLVYNTNTVTGTGFFYWNGAQWTRMAIGGDSWSLTGNNGTNPTANFLGTTDAQDLVFRTNNNERVRIYAGGRVELNETFDANGTANSGVLEIANSLRLDGNEIITNTNGTLYLQNDNNGDLRVSNNTLHVDAADNSVGINSTAPTEELHVVGGSRITTGLTIGSTANYGDHLILTSSNTQPAIKIGYQGGFNNAESGRFIFDEYADNYLNVGTYCGFQFHHDGAANKLYLGSACTAETIRVTFERGGDVGIGTVNPTALLSVNGTANKTGGGTWAVFSDKRLKKDVQNYDEGLELIKQIQPVSFKYNETMNEIWGDNNIQDKVYQGVIAQDLQKIAPDMVTEVSIQEDYSNDQDGGSSNSTSYFEVDPNKFTYALINAVKQQNKIIEGQQNKISSQEGKINDLEERIKRLEEMMSK